jgi:nucleotide-binding universal stress UspA family protein
LRILVCTDGSEQGERALRVTAELAAACHAEATLLGIKETPGNSDAILNALRRGQQLFEGRKLSAESVSKSGEPIEEIVKRTQETAYDLVVIGAMRKGPYGPFSMSAKAYKIIKRVKPPVLVVMGNPASWKRILVCSGGKGYIESAFELVGEIARATGASITLLHVQAEPPAIYSEIREWKLDPDRVLQSNSELGRNLRRERELLQARGLATEIHLRQGLVLEEISREIRTGQYDLIVAGSSLSTGALRTYILGDVTREIVNRANCPVLVTRHTHGPRTLKEIFGELLHGFSFSPLAEPTPKP